MQVREECFSYETSWVRFELLSKFGTSHPASSPDRLLQEMNANPRELLR
jgi:hypothetical protein